MNFKDHLHTETITHIDLSYYVEVEKGTRVRDVIEKMQASHRKCALVMDRGQMVGIFTERDIVKKLPESPGLMDDPIEGLMTPDPETIDADATVIHAVRVMTSNPYRYMPVVNKKGKIVGTLTHYALMKHVSDHFPEDIYNLPPDSEKIPGKRDGA